MRTLFLAVTHIGFAAGGFALGIYMLPILMAPEAPSTIEVAGIQSQSTFNGTFRRDLQDSDLLHWGEGEVSIGEDVVTLMGSIAPGPDYRLYLSPKFVETEQDFLALKSSMVQVGPVKTFDNFIVKMPSGINPADFTAVIIWCEAFGQFITAASYK